MKKLNWVVLVTGLLVASPSAATDTVCSGGDRTPLAFHAGDYCDSVGGLQPAADDQDVAPDGYANQCDADFDHDCIVGVSDFLIMHNQWLLCPIVNPAYNQLDLDLDTCLNILDFALFSAMFGLPPGP